MKLTKLETAALGVALAAVFFTCGWFAGRRAAPDIQVTVQEPGERTDLQEPGAAGLTVNINIAGPRELTALPGVGEGLADKIVAYREENGPFRAPEELMSVPGIGEGLFDAIQEYIAV